MICPNCGASNSSRASYCRRCRQRLPAAGFVAGVTYPRRRSVGGGDGGGSRLAVYAAIFLAVSAFLVGALLVGFARPVEPLSTAIAVVSASPTLPPFEQSTPEPTPTPEATPMPTPDLTQGPPVETPIASFETTPSPLTTPQVSPQPTPRPTRSPTPTPAPTPPPLTFSCATATGVPTESVTIGSNDPNARTANWCLDTASFRFFPGSAYGTVRLMHNGERVASFTCEVGQNCAGPIVRPIRGQPRLARRGDTLRFEVVRCVDPPETAVNECEGDGIIATIEVGYERALRP